MRRALDFGGLFNSLAENRTPPGRAYDGQNFSVDLGILKLGPRDVSIGSRTGALATDVCWGFGFGKFTTNQTAKFAITGGTPSSGAVAIVVDGTPTATSAQYNSSAADLQAILQSVTDYEEGEISCTGGPWPTSPIYVTQKGRYAGTSGLSLAAGTSTLNNSAALTITTEVSGGAQEEYLVVIQPGGSGDSTLYKVTSTDGFVTSTWTSVATGLDSSDWYFRQMADKVYGANHVDGIAWKQLGGNWSVPAGITGVQSPTGWSLVSFAQTYPTGFDFSAAPFGSPSFSNYSGWGTNPTITVVSGKLQIHLNAALTNAQVSFEIDGGGDLDFSRQNFVEVLFTSNPTQNTVDPASILIEWINNDGTPLTIDPEIFGSGKADEGASTASYSRRFYFGHSTRTSRDNVRKMVVSFKVTRGTSGTNLTLALKPQDSWLNDRMATIDIDGGPTRKAMSYACSYVKTSTGEESKLSPVEVTEQIPPNFANGGYVALRAFGSAQLTTSGRIRVHRLDRFGAWRTIGEKANATSGTVLFNDVYMEDELSALPIYGGVHLPGGFYPDQIGIWQGCLVAAGDRKSWISAPDQPTTFAPDPQSGAEFPFDPTDPFIPRTVYVSRDRSEAVLAIVGQDPLFFAGPFSAYAMTGGDTPATLSLPRPLPGSRGTVGSRGANPLGSGAMIASRTALWYYAVSTAFEGFVRQGDFVEEELTKEVRQSWADLIGSDGSDAVVLMFEEQLWAFNGAAYVHRSRSGNWEQGILDAAVKEAIANPANGLIVATSTGTLKRLAADTGTGSWSYATGILDGERGRLKQFECQYTGSPSVLIEAWDGGGGYAYERFDLIDGKVTHFPSKALSLLQGWRFRVTFSGDETATVEAFASFWEPLAGGKNS